MTNDDRFRHHAFLKNVADQDVEYVLVKDKSYGASWKLSGGRSAWFMLKRKIDRLCEMLRPMTQSDVAEMIGFSKARGTPKKHDDTATIVPTDGYVRMRELLAKAAVAEDIFAAIGDDVSGADSTVLAEVRDLRRYLLLVEAEILSRKKTVRVSDFVDVKIVLAPVPEEMHACDTTHGNYMFTQTTRDPDDPCVQMHALGDGPCMRCGHPQNDHLHRMVPRTMSSCIYYRAPLHSSDGLCVSCGESRIKHPQPVYQERADRRALLDSGAPRPCISNELFRTLSPHLAGKYVLVGKVALVDRAQLSESQRESMLRYPQTMTCGELAMLADWVPVLYEPRTGVENEVQLKAQFREHWGK